MDASVYVAAEPELPRRIGRYDALLQIGTGGMARVYLGVQHGPFAAKKLVAIKQVSEEIGRDRQYLEMFIDEARIALRLNHPNVVHTYEVLDEAPEYYLVMEFLEGQSLLEVLRRIGREKMPLHEHIWILSQLLAGLHYAHELRDFDGTPLKIVHRDVTPSNVFVCSCGGVKLLDFGIAKAALAVAATRTGMIKGKLGYVSPEQCLAQPAGVRSDIYAVGVMLWEAMARQRRLSGETQAAQLHARIQGLEPPIEQVWPQAPQALAAMARRALSVDPEHRYTSARDFQRDLELYLKQQKSSAGAESVSRLLRQHFKQERAALNLAIESHIVVGERVPSAAVAASATPLVDGLSQANDNDVTSGFDCQEDSLEDAQLDSQSDSNDANTLRASLDHALLRASTPGSLFARARRSLRAELRAYGGYCVGAWSALAAGVLALRTRRGAALTVSAAVVSAATVWILIAQRPASLLRGAISPDFSPRLERSSTPTLRGAAVERRSRSRAMDAELLVCLAPDVPGSIGGLNRPAAPAAARAGPGELAAPAPAPSTAAAQALVDRQRIRINDDLRPLAPAADSAAAARGTLTTQTTTPHPTQSRPSARSSLGGRLGARRVEPGTDLWGTTRERRERSIDEENPYEP